jgi:glycosyltransferase involved in cell wall biosynthesis
MFSIVIPLYNKAAHIEKALRSVLNQSYHEFELIIVNDGSTDNSLQTVETYLRAQKESGNESLVEHVRIIDQPNAGVAVARNNGVKAAKYDYIAFLDADDWWHKQYLSTMKELIEQCPEAKLYSASYYQVKDGKHLPAIIGVYDFFSKGYIDYCEVYAKTFYMPVWTSAAVVRKDVFKEFGGFKPNLKLGEDFDLWIRIALKYKVAFCNQPLACYNHDVDKTQQASACGRLYSPEEHYIFQLDYLLPEEQVNPSLKKLLDLLRVYLLLPYYLNKPTQAAARYELDKVDWKTQPLKERIRYHMPIPVLKLENWVLKRGSGIKRNILNSRHTKHTN